MSKNFELLQQAGEGHDLFQTSSHPADPFAVAVSSAIPARAVPAAAPARGAEAPKEAVKSRSLPIDWLTLIKERARRWTERVQSRDVRSATRLQAIARAEELKLIQRIFHAADGPAPRVVLFAGLEGDLGCASICARIGGLLTAQPDEHVCIVDANFQSPSLHRLVGMENLKGFAEALLDTGPIRDFARQLPASNLWVIPAGAEAVQFDRPMVANRLRARIAELRAEFQYVVIHSSPLGLETEPILLGRCTDGVVLVLEADSTRRETARRAKEILEVANVRMLGVVLNNRAFPIPDVLYRRL